MENNIYELLKSEYNINSINDIYNYLVTKKDLKKNIKGLKFGPIEKSLGILQNEKAALAYDYFKQQLIVNPDLLYKYANIAANSNFYGDLNSFEKDIFTQTYVIEKLSKEINFASLQKQSLNPENLEGVILNAVNHVPNKVLKLNKLKKAAFLIFPMNVDKDLYEDVITNKEFRQRNKEIVIDERLSKLNSLRDVLEVLKPIENEVPNLILEYEQQYYYHLLYAYKFINSYDGPTVHYLKQLRDTNINDINNAVTPQLFETLANNKDHDCEEAVRLGLKTTKETHNVLIKKLIALEH